MSTFPLWLWVAGVVLLGCIIAYGIRKTGQRTRSERARTDSATKELYRREDRSA
jgi:uncharacterized membrane protein